MANKFSLLILLSFFITACDGGKVQFTSPTSTKTAEPYIELDQGAKAEFSATYIRGSALGVPNKIVVNGRTYFISKFSSVDALSFENEVTLGQSISVTIQGNPGQSETGHAPTPDQAVAVYVVATIKKI